MNVSTVKQLGIMLGSSCIGAVLGAVLILKWAVPDLHALQERPSKVREEPRLEARSLASSSPTSEKTIALGLSASPPVKPALVVQAADHSGSAQPEGSANSPTETAPPGAGTFEAAEGDFYLESRDGRWAQRNESLIVTIAQRFPQTRMSEVECREKHCRVVLGFPGVDAYNAMFRGIAEDPDLAQSGMVANIEENQATLYVSRAEATATR